MCGIKVNNVACSLQIVSIMSIKKKTNNPNKGGSLEKDIEKLQESGLIEEKDKAATKQDKHGDPTTKEQQKTGGTERSDRRL